MYRKKGPVYPAVSGNYRGGGDATIFIKSFNTEFSRAHDSIVQYMKKVQLDALF